MDGRELYELIGRNYRLPVWGRSLGDRMWVSVPSVPWLAQQLAVMETTLLELSGSRRGPKGEWIIHEDAFGKFFIKSTATDPQDVVVWNWRQELYDRQEPAGDFIEYYCRHPDAVFRDKALMAILWASLLKVAAEWVVTRGRILDLTFARVCALPLRSNWKAILKKRQRIASKYAAYKEDKFFAEQLTPDNLSSWSEHTRSIRWTLNVEATRYFNELMARVETARKRGLRGEKGYWQRCKEVMRSYEKRVREIYATYLAETNQKTVRILKGKRRGHAGDSEQQPMESDVAVALPAPDDYAGGQDGSEPVCAREQTVMVGSDEAGLLQMSDLQSLCPDVRNSVGGASRVDAAGPQSAGAAGVPVLDAVESAPENKLLPLRQTAGAGAEATLAASL